MVRQALCMVSGRCCKYTTRALFWRKAATPQNTAVSISLHIKPILCTQQHLRSLFKAPLSLYAASTPCFNRTVSRPVKVQYSHLLCVVCSPVSDKHVPSTCRITYARVSFRYNIPSLCYYLADVTQGVRFTPPAMLCVFKQNTEHMHP